ncbi:hypothetical protein Spb1_11600 [Planctopirus ephydatiae]|uniref:Bacterial membrane protein YfhO n=1 Tax=Planctopirus ephydatiae TaxID=2528019 RepID=A0A518GKX7_9PLAN|nr:YfhO family protein [Planctopirus ephydatiae]QDV29280.1 hypothetical protein Spb1_11600 [Planctopirus ephydatiae]
MPPRSAAKAVAERSTSERGKRAPSFLIPEWLWALGAAILASWLAWASFYEGSTLIGGDLYTYLLPQKAFFQQELAAGRWPLWNNLTGHGYPVLAESQTAVFYPPRLLSLSLFTADHAYSAEQLAHYVAAFFCMWLYLKQIGVSIPGTIFGCVVYVYGWFPTRIILEWAIIGGLYLPLGLWLIERFLQRKSWKYAIALAGVLGLHLLAGHYNLAFIEVLVWLVYIPVRLWLLPTIEQSPQASEVSASTRLPLAIALFLAIGFGFGLGAAQLLPTWELKGQSQRAEKGQDFQPGYGHIPPQFLGQLFAPTWWNPAKHNIDEELSQMWSPTGAGTNRVEAHLYVGLAVWMGLVGAGWLAYRKTGNSNAFRWIGVFLLGSLVAIIFATGLPLFITASLPGFSYFTGPGRFGIVATFCLAVAGAFAWDQILSHVAARYRWILWCLVIGFTWFDLQIVSMQATYGVIIEKSPYSMISKSEVRRILLADARQPVRVYAPGANLPNLLGVSTTPVFLGIGPAAYFSPAARFPAEAPLSQQIEFLSKQGVTHWLTMTPLTLPASGSKNSPTGGSTNEESLRLVWSGFDEFLNRAWGRFDEPLYLYSLPAAPGRCYMEGIGSQPARKLTIVQHGSQRIELKVEAGPRQTLVLTELADRDWKLTINGQPASWEAAGLSRKVEVPEGEAILVWSYQPWSLGWGVGISLFTALILATIGHIRFWHPQWTRGWLPQAP